MTHLYIEQNNGITEEVLSSVISKLYELALSGNLDESSNLIGRLHTNATYLEYIDFLTNKFLNLHISTDNIYLLFRDKNIELVLLDSGVGDGVGITITNALAFTNIPNDMFANNQEILDFSDLNIVFPNCSIIGNGAFAQSTIKYVNFSKITTIYNGAFYDSSLEGELDIPLLSGTIGQNCFKNTNISKITNLGTITAIQGRTGYGVSPFSDCPNLTEVVLPSTIRTLDDCFLRCPSLSKITGLEYITTLNTKIDGVFSDEVWHFDNLTTITILNFNNKTLKQLYCPKVAFGFDSKTDSYMENWYWHKGLFINLTCNLLYLKDINKLYPGDIARANINALVINNNTPPSLNNRNDELDENITDDSFKWNRVFTDSNLTIYVPDSAVSTYQSDVKWSTLNLDIRPISGLPKYATEEVWEEAGKPIALIEEYM